MPLPSHKSRLEMLKLAKDYVDIYLQDYKYADASLAAKLSR